MIQVNGVSMEHMDGLSIAEFLKKNDYKKEYVAIERNGQIVPKKDYETVVLENEDSLEVVSFVGGG